MLRQRQICALPTSKTSRLCVQRLRGSRSTAKHEPSARGALPRGTIGMDMQGLFYTLKETQSITLLKVQHGSYAPLSATQLSRGSHKWNEVPYYPEVTQPHVFLRPGQGCAGCPGLC